MSGFYVGYLPKAPADIRHRVRRVVVALAAVAVAASLVLVFSQSPFPPSAFDFLNVRTFEGVLEESPYPALVVSRPGASGTAGYSRYILVGEGKHGADAEVRGRSGRRVQLRGKLIFRDDQTMVEVVAGSLRDVGPATPVPAAVELGAVTLTGEIVDSKCYTGVMNPGRGKVHRDCTARCISGGIPAALVVNDAKRGSVVYLLTDPEGQSLGRELLDIVAVPVEVTGAASRKGDTFYLTTSSRQIVRLQGR